MLNKKIKAFTLSELMVTLALTTIMLCFVYLGYNSIQKLLTQFNEQSSFITQINELKHRFTLLSNSPGDVIKENDTRYIIKTGSIDNIIEFTARDILLSREGLTDTFHLKPIDIKTEIENIKNPVWYGKLLNKIGFDVSFEGEKFHLEFTKQYDAYSKLILETQNNN